MLCELVQGSKQGCEFHFKQSVEKYARRFTDRAPRFRQLADDLLNASTPEAFEATVNIFRAFAQDQDSLTYWLHWWLERKDFMFQAFSDC